VTRVTSADPLTRRSSPSPRHAFSLFSLSAGESACLLSPLLLLLPAGYSIRFPYPSGTRRELCPSESVLIIDRHCTAEFTSLRTR
jgi:hypothetical protein